MLFDNYDFLNILLFVLEYFFLHPHMPVSHTAHPMQILFFSEHRDSQKRVQKEYL